jgi:hypothetical protein
VNEKQARMNAILLQLLTSRLGGANPGMAEMLARMTSGGASAVPNAGQMLAQLANSSDPSVSLLAKQLAEQQDRQAQSPLSIVREVEAEVVTDSARRPNPALSDGNSTEPEALLAEIKELRNRCDDLALALGACALCWGKDPECRACRGRGRPGFAVPDGKLFVEFVLPAVRLLKTQKAKDHYGSSVNIQPKPAGPDAGQNEGATNGKGQTNGNVGI